MVDFFGQHLFSMMNQTLDEITDLVESDEARVKLGTIKAEPFRAASELTPEQKTVALNLAQASVHRFLRMILALLTGTGSDLRYGSNHAIRYRLVMEIIGRSDFELIMEEALNRGGEKAFFDYYGRWLNRHRQFR